jgi:hypothetical protein
VHGAAVQAAPRLQDLEALHSQAQDGTFSRGREGQSVVGWLEA